MSDEVNQNTGPAEEPAPPAAEAPKRIEDPILIDEPVYEPAPPLPTDEASEPKAPADSEEPDQIFSGEHTRIPQAEMPLPVTEPMTEDMVKQFAKYGQVLMPNLNIEEVMTLEQILRLRIMTLQRERYLAVKEGAPRSSYIELDLGDDGILLLVQEERQAWDHITTHKRNTALQTLTDIIKENEHLTNMPKVGDTVLMGALEVTGEKAKDRLMAVRDKLGISPRIQFPLWSSGLHIKLTGPGALAQIGLDTICGQEKVKEAMESGGYSFSASSVYLNRELADFAIDQMVSTTAGTVDKATLKELILLPDLEQLVNMLAFSLYPKGFPVVRRCLRSDFGCDGEVKEVININRTSFLLDSRLGENQLKFMSKRAGAHDIKTIRNYQSQMRPEISRLIDLGEGVLLKLRVPTLAQYESTATNWLDNMTTKARQLISSNAREEDRQNYLQQAQAVSTVMAYAHWVEAVVERTGDLDVEPEVVKSRIVPEGSAKDVQYKADLEIDNFLRDFAANEELTTRFTDGLQEFIAAMTINPICITRVTCPKCGHPIDPHTKDEKGIYRHPALVAINPVEFFFTLLRHKIGRALRPS